MLKPGKEIDEWVKAPLDAPWVRKTDKDQHLQLSAGKHKVRVAFLFDGGPRPVSQMVEIVVGAQSDWGKDDGGIQARVRTPKRVWDAKEAKTFVLDLQNVGDGKPHSLHIPFDCEVEVDGKWYTYSGPVDVTSQDTTLEPGKNYRDWVRVTPDNLWTLPRAESEVPTPLRWTPGKHTIRLAYPIRSQRPSLRPVSGAVEIEVRQEG